MTEEPTKKDSTKSAKTILLIGGTGSGKSALANVITDTDNFSEDSGSTSETRNHQIKEYSIDENLYRIVDTTGIGYTELADQEVLFKLVEEIDFFEYGLYQILFVINGRFTDKEIQVYKSLSEVFGKDVVEYITIVRTNFPEFSSKDNEDIGNMIKENDDLSTIIHRCNIIYVDNPPIIYKDIAEDNRKKSREIMLGHLSSWNKLYLPKYNEIEDIEEKKLFEKVLGFIKKLFENVLGFIKNLFEKSYHCIS